MIKGFGLRGYRSFWGSGMQFVGPMSKVHLVVGQNNSGKSNLLQAAQKYLPQLRTRDFRGPIDFDRPLHTQAPDHFKLAVSFDFSSTELEIMLGDRSTTPALAAFAEFFRLPAFNLAPGGPWFVAEPARVGNAHPVNREQMDAIVSQWHERDQRGDGHGWQNQLRMMMNALNVRDQGSIASTLYVLISELFTLGKIPSITTISAFRQIREDQENSEDYSGVGLVKRLARLESPGALRHQKDSATFEAINEFARQVLEDPSARLRVPASQDVILVEHGGRVLELDHLGTGIHEVIILAVAATLLEGHLVCIEEPEVHLHPILQRRLIRYLKNETSNHYLIATHSAQILDLNIASVSHVRIGDQGSSVQPATSSSELSRLTQELGYKASDIIQANVVIWVEGPSDRIYLRCWITAGSGGELIEGIHYSIMFYGGRLLSHLAPEDERIPEFISLSRLNRNLVVLIDSDKRSQESPVNATKERIQESFGDEKVDGFAWITEGREIENYVPAALLKAALKAVHPSREPDADGQPYSNALSLKTPLAGGVDKVAVAEAVAKSWDASTRGLLDLPRMVQTVVDYIKRVNLT